MKTNKTRRLWLYFFIISIGFAFSLLTSCEKELMPGILPNYTYETDSITDIDGNVYKTVKIGDQWWMAENLRVKRYRNNQPIVYFSVMPIEEWTVIKKGAHCYLNNFPGTVAGPYYNWYVVANTSGIAPEGWHIPTDEDWKKLERFLGMSTDSVDLIGWRGAHVGEKMKASKNNILSWKLVQNIFNSNESGFSALPGSCVLHNASWGDPGSPFAGFWWTASENGEGTAWYRYLDYGRSDVFRYYAPKNCGFSIRCVKD